MCSVFQALNEDECQPLKIEELELETSAGSDRGAEKMFYFLSYKSFHSSSIYVKGRASKKKST